MLAWRVLGPQGLKGRGKGEEPHDVVAKMRRSRRRGILLWVPTIKQDRNGRELDKMRQASHMVGYEVPKMHTKGSVFGESL